MIASSCFWLTLVSVIGRNLAELFIQPGGVRRRPAHASGRVSLLLLALGHWISSTAVLVYLFIDGGCRTPWVAIGLFLVLAAFCGRVAGIRTLGASYHQLIKAPAGGLVTVGVYSVVRHPLYLFYCMEMCGFLIVRPNPLSLLAMLIVIAASLWRMRDEENLLAREYGRAFQEYRRKTKRFIPFIW